MQYDPVAIFWSCVGGALVFLLCSDSKESTIVHLLAGALAGFSVWLLCTLSGNAVEAINSFLRSL